MRFAFTVAAGLALLSNSTFAAPSLARDTSLETSQHPRGLKEIAEKAISWLCDLPRADVVCQKTMDIISSQGLLPTRAKVVSTPQGMISAFNQASTYRYTVPYAKSPVGNRRFKPPVALPDWTGIYNASKLPPACPQSDLLSSGASTTEDCLFMNVWVPITATSTSKLPVFVWLHGGSFVAGSASDAALDGSALAAGGNMIVITMQYRLGVLGLLRAHAAGVEGNMAVLDVVQALSYIKSNIPSFGGDPSAVTLAGQSSGADMIKTLFTTPKADTLFQRAILHSAPLNYGDHSFSTSSAIGKMFISDLGCSTLSCLQSAKIESILASQDNTFLSAPYEIPGVAASEPFRPLIDNTIVTASSFKFANDAKIGNKNRQIIFTTVKDEAGPTIASVSQDQQIPIEYYGAYVEALMDPDRASKVLLSGLYDPKAKDDAAREQLELLGTDWVWRCANQQAALNLTTHGETGKIWIAEFDAGVPYPSNQGIGFCKGRVCHQDDIQAVFSTGEGITTQQANLSKEVLNRWSAFAKTGVPDVPGYLKWPAVSVTNDANYRLNMLVIDGAIPRVVVLNRRAQCGPNGFWGRTALFDEQLNTPAVTKRMAKRFGSRVRLHRV